MTVPVAIPLISRNVPAYTNDDFSGAFPAAHANNAVYGDYWRCATATVSGNSGALTQAVYLAYDLSGVASSQRKQCVVVMHNDPATGVYNPTIIANNYFNTPQAYTIDANTAAGGSLPGSDWTTLVTVTSNAYHSRQHAVDLTGYNWIRINITAITGSASNNNAACNLDVHDAHLGNQDNWIFYGDSITQRGLDFEDTTLEAQINAALPTRYPIMECAGIGGLASADGASNIATWLPLFSGQYVGLLYGTNDANDASVGDPNFATTFYNSMVTMITAIIGAGKIPVMPKTITWGSTANLVANAPIINTKLALLRAAYPSSVVGPDLYAYFSANQSLISGDGIHPTDPAGYAAYRTLWLDFATAFYTQSSAYLLSRRHRIGAIQ